MFYVAMLSGFNLLTFGFKFLKKIKKAKPIIIYLIYFNLLFFCVKKKSVFVRVFRIIYQEKTVYIPRKNCLYTKKKLYILGMF